MTNALPVRRRAAVALLAALALSLSLVPPAASAATPAPRVPAGLPKAIEAPAPYAPATSCDPTAKPGTVKLAKLLKKTYPSTGYYVTRACGTRPNSEHLEGRAIDWMTNVRNKPQAAQAKTTLNWLFATDKAGQRFANARRLGVMYIIWNNKIWSSYSANQGWRNYQNCSNRPQKSLDGVCHRNHIHLSLSWEGAMGRTSFWTKSVARRDYGPCRPADLNWAAPYRKANPVRCTRYARVSAPKGASATRRTLTTYSGMELRVGSKGTAVKAVQKVVKVSADGRFGAKTKAGVQKWQKAHRISASGVVEVKTWRALLKAVK